MLILKAKIREKTGKKVKKLRQKGILPAVLYGPKTKNLPLEVDSKEFEKIYKEAGESSLISLELDPSAEGSQVGKFLVLIHETKKDPINGEIIHADFYQPILTKEVEAMVPIVFEGEPLAVKELGGTLVKEISEVEVKALPQNLPHEIKVNVESLKTFEDEILIKDLRVAEGVKIQRKPNEIVAVVSPPEKVEEVKKVEKEEEDRPMTDQPKAEKKDGKK